MSSTVFISSYLNPTLAACVASRYFIRVIAKKYEHPLRIIMLLTLYLDLDSPLLKMELIQSLSSDSWRTIRLPNKTERDMS